MSKIIIDFALDSKNTEELEKYRDNQKDYRLKLRFASLIMLGTSSDPQYVANIFGISTYTLENWTIKYLENGPESLDSFNYKPRTSKLDPAQLEEAKKHFFANPPGTAKEAAAWIEEKFNVSYCDESVRLILKKMGLKFLKPRKIPGNPPSETEQVEWIEKHFKRRKEAEEGSVFLYGDAMHLQHNPVAVEIWTRPGKNRHYIKTNTGRKRLNILGAYNADTHDFIHLTGEKNCDRERAIEYLELILNHYSSAPLIVLYLDNAKYFKAADVTEWLEAHPELKVEYLPAYSPNLNLIERFWKFVKKHLVRNKYHRTYKSFRANAFRFLNHVEDYREELESLMTEKFEIIKTEDIIFINC